MPASKLSPEELCAEIGAIDDEVVLRAVFLAAVRNAGFVRIGPDAVVVPIQTIDQSIKDFSPSEFWDERDKSKKETPVDFIKRVYAEVLTGWFTVADLKQADPKLYRAYYNWQCSAKNPRPSLGELNLPTLPEFNDRLLSLFNFDASDQRNFRDRILRLSEVARKRENTEASLTNDSVK